MSEQNDSYTVWYGDASDPVETEIEASDVSVRPVDGEGTRKLVATRDTEKPRAKDEDDHETAMCVTVGPKHVLGYRKN